MLRGAIWPPTSARSPAAPYLELCLLGKCGQRASEGNATFCHTPQYAGVMRQRTVAGESIELLRAAFGKLQHRTTSDGMVELTWRLEPELGEPFCRAVLRIEMELLAQDVARGDPDVRTTEQRRADAFVLLAERLTSPRGRS